MREPAQRLGVIVVTGRRGELAMLGVSQPDAHASQWRLLFVACTWGYGTGFAIAILLMFFGVVRSGFHVAGYSLVLGFAYWPALGLAAGCMLWRPANRAPDHLSEAPQSVTSRTRRRFVEAGVAVGVVYGLVVTALEVVSLGWSILTLGLVFNLLVFPLLGLLVGTRVRRASGEPRGSRRFGRLSIQAMMLLVAYVALLCASVLVAVRVGGPALRYQQKYVQSRELAASFRDVVAPRIQSEASLHQRNAEQLRQGTIPDGLMQVQKDFLKSLNTDSTVKPDARTYRYKVMADEEVRLGGDLQKALDFVSQEIAYYSRLASKYDHAQHQPWLPVAPDPPPPKQ